MFGVQMYIHLQSALNVFHMQGRLMHCSMAIFSCIKSRMPPVLFFKFGLATILTVYVSNNMMISMKKLEVSKQPTVRKPAYGDRPIYSPRELIPSKDTPKGLGDVYVHHNFAKPGTIPHTNDSVTLCLQTTHDKLFQIEEIMKRWKGPISVSVFAAGSDIETAEYYIKYIKKCFQTSHRIRALVTFSLIYPSDHGPDHLKCFSPALATCLPKESISVTNYTKSKNIIFPYNLARNVAIRNSKSHYHLVSDIDLLPSKKIPQRFLDMPLDDPKTVYILPMVKVNGDVSVPDNKSELIRLYVEGKASVCHESMKAEDSSMIKDWLSAKSGANDTLTALISRTKTTIEDTWEPAYIGTKNLPKFNSRYSAKAKSRVTQAIEMGLMGYKFAIINEAFLCHAPDSSENTNEIPHAEDNQKVFDSEIERLKRTYFDNTA